MTDAVDVEGLRTLLEKAAKGPWRVGPVDDTVVTGPDHLEIAAIDGDYNDPDLWPVMEANAALIVAARNALPALLDENAALRARCDALAGALEPFAKKATTAEVLSPGYESPLDGLSVNARIKGIGQRRAQHDANVLAARAALALHRGEQGQ